MLGRKQINEKSFRYIQMNLATHLAYNKWKLKRNFYKKNLSYQKNNNFVIKCWNTLFRLLIVIFFLQFLTKNEIKNEVSLQLKSELCLFNDKNMRIIKISGERQLATIWESYKVCVCLSTSKLFTLYSQYWFMCCHEDIDSYI